MYCLLYRLGVMEGFALLGEWHTKAPEGVGNLEQGAGGGGGHHERSAQLHYVWRGSVPCRVISSLTGIASRRVMGHLRVRKC